MAAAAAAGGEGGGGVSMLAVPQQQTNIYSLMPQEEPIPQSNMEPEVAIDPNAMGLRARNGSESTDEVVLLTDKSDSQEQMGFVTAI